MGISGPACRRLAVVLSTALLVTTAATASATGATAATSAPVVSAGGAHDVTLVSNPVFSYRGTDAGGAITEVTGRYRTAATGASFGAFVQRWPRLPAAGSVTAPTLAAGMTLCASFRAISTSGAASPWSAERCAARPLDDRSLTASTGWTRTSATRYYAGTVSRSATSGRTLKRTGLRMRRSWIVATTCSGCGSVDVLWNGSVVKRVSLAAATTTNRRVLPLISFASTRTGTLVLRSVSRSPVYVDALATSLAVATTGPTAGDVLVTTTSLPPGVAGLPYVLQLQADGGVGPYTWHASGVPAGMAVSPEGAVTGAPNAIGSSHPAVTATDTRGHVSSRTLALSVPTGLPPGCVESNCSQTSPNGTTTDVPASAVVSEQRDSSGQATQLVLNGIKAAVGTVLVLQPASGAGTGSVAVVQSVVNNPDGTATLGVAHASPADAYASGLVRQTSADPIQGTEGITTATSSASGRATSNATQAQAASTAPSCSGDPSPKLTTLTVSPKFTPSITAQWKHPLFSSGGFSPGTGGLTLFQADLQGSLNVAVDVQVASSTTCTLTLGTLTKAFPAGDLGAVVVDLSPVITLKVGAAAHVHTSVTFTCGVEYRWDNGVSYPGKYCAQSHEPLSLTSDSGVDVSVGAGLNMTVSLDEIAGITGSLNASVHAGFHPTQSPNGVLDAQVDWQLGACLACLFKDSPAQVTLASGTIWHKTLATYNFPVSSAGGSGGGGSVVSDPGTTTLYGTPGGTGSGSVVTGHYDGNGTAEATGGNVRTFSNYANGGGTEGPTVAAHNLIGVACRLSGLTVQDGNSWWYQIATSPWSGAYYASADAFYNNGSTNGSLTGTPFVDLSVPTCASGGGTAAPGTPETAG